MRALNSLKNNRGSSVIMVLIAMTFITILGTILIYTAYTGFQIKVAQTRGERSFYSAEIAMDEIRAGVQGYVAQSITLAYTEMLTAYSHEMSVEEAFAEAFKKVFSESALFGNLNDTKEKIESFISGTGITTDFSELSVDSAPDKITIRNIKLTYRSADGFVSTIESDIVIAFPDISEISRAPDYALVATGALNVQAVQGVEIKNGNAFAGSVSITNLYTALKINDGMLVSGGNITINPGSSFTTDPRSTLWANRITVESGGTVTLGGSTYVQDDLELSGNNASATLAGRYYGFGTQMTDAQKSSSIIINGLDSTLDMSGLSELFLAGHSFVGNNNSGGDVLMGQSISVRTDQLAYLIPVGAINGQNTNPIIFTSGDPVITNDDINYNFPLWTIGGIPKTLGYYSTGVRKIYNPLGDGVHTLLYLFMEFASVEKANEYFKDYLIQNKAEMADYILLYLKELEKGTNTQTAGVYYTIEYNSDDCDIFDCDGCIDCVKIIVNDAYPKIDDMKKAFKRFNGRFENLKSSLNINIKATNPFDYIVKTDEVNKLESNITEFKIGEDVIGIIAKGDVSLDSYPHARFVIATGNVSYYRAFTGMIISNGTVAVYGKTTVNPPDIADMRSAIIDIENDSRSFADFLNLRTSSRDTLWDVSSLVYYENWRRS